ncbi:hypothetical protein [Mucilaginibacter polytrichastri]|uniref:Lipocalin-like domain-containing protein n=1 Tax=Mucilaginibacter polytrichastri TaxID=1302689 RepID=A0A1Q5ZTX9_9SPHI|nr:hypothetical protein [Mucilaginibacter polytrichastri]OKS85183.1 hypothetical protein RG47T_0627 [Mucilaginibacter polytrichastri]SFS43086.1 hypothetical protein SAMN04487890_101457 [Mucilaginibacter polytrichastri]
MKKRTLIIFVALLFSFCCVNAKSTQQNITGFYKAEPLEEGGTSCDLSVLITKANGQYFYNLKINGKSRKGRVKITKGDKAGETYINFTGIKWAEYEGDVSKLGDDDERPSLKLPVGIDGVLQGKEITIQNYGNAMNYYVKFFGCEEKFIRLVRQ